MLSNLAFDHIDLKLYYKDAFRNSAFSIIYYSNRYVNVIKCQWGERQ